MNPLGIDFSAERGDLDLVLLHAKPALDHALLDLEMKLKSVNVRAVTERLMGAKRGEREVPAGSRNIEGFAVPLEYFFRRCPRAEQRIVFGLFGRCNIVPADFFLPIGLNCCAEGFRDQLRPQAN